MDCQQSKQEEYFWHKDDVDDDVDDEVDDDDAVIKPNFVYL